MAQGRCPYYFEQSRTFGGSQARPERKAQGQIPLIPYCEHKHSPARRLDVLKKIGAANSLTCGGDLAKCQVPPPLRLDTG